jgi:alpha-beta hydrolase superfamily lysophospholipase
MFDDFIAAAEHLIAEGYTSRNRLAILGDSNGGLLMGSVMTQRPELIRAVVSHVGLYDMLRWELEPNGAFANGQGADTVRTVAHRRNCTGSVAFSIAGKWGDVRAAAEESREPLDDCHGVGLGGRRTPCKSKLGRLMK